MIDNKQIRRRWLTGLGILAFFSILIWQLESLATLLLLSFLVAYVLNPLVTRLDRLRFVNRIGGTLLTLISGLVIILAVMFIVIPEVITEFRALMSRLPEHITSIQTTVVPKVEKLFGITIPVSFDDAFKQYGQDINKIASRVIGPLTNIVAVVFGQTFSALGAFVATLMFPLFTFFLLKDFPRIVEAVDKLIPHRNRPTIHNVAKEVDKSLSAFLHGQFTVMIILGTLYATGYSIVGIPVAVGVGMLTGLLCFIPYVGAATGFILALLLSLLDFQGFGRILAVAGVFSTVQLLDAVFITPKILGGKLGLRPIWIIAALMAGGELFGFLGVLLAVPTTAVLKVLISHTLERYKQSNLYLAKKQPSTDSSTAP